jgi:hypothetical protein
MDAWYRSLSSVEKGDLIREAWNTARALQLAGLHARFPDESEEQLELRLAERWLGRELFERAMAQKRARGLG